MYVKHHNLCLHVLKACYVIMTSGVITAHNLSQFTTFWVLVRLLHDGCQQPKHVAVDWYMQVVGLLNWNNLVNFKSSLDIKIFLYFMIINFLSLNKYIRIIFVTSFHISGSQVKQCFLVGSNPPRHIHFTRPTTWYLWTHRV